MALILLASPANAFGSFSPNLYRWTLISQINYFRTHHGLRALAFNANLQRAASAHSTNMAQHHVLSHTSASGVSWSTRIRWYGYRGTYIGENLGVGLVRPYRMFEMWLASPPHRANLLSSRFNAAGIGVVMGTWAGHLAIYVTNDFGG